MVNTAKLVTSTNGNTRTVIALDRLTTNARGHKKVLSQWWGHEADRQCADHHDAHVSWVGPTVYMTAKDGDQDQDGSQCLHEHTDEQQENNH